MYYRHLVGKDYNPGIIEAEKRARGYSVKVKFAENIKPMALGECVRMIQMSKCKRYWISNKAYMYLLTSSGLPDKIREDIKTGVCVIR